MKFSIIIPLYNKEHSIRRAVYSALDQHSVNENDVEIFIINDGSTDSSVEQVIKIVCEQSHRKITLVNQLNQGVSAARNRGVSLTKHPIVCFLDADDTYKPGFLAELCTLYAKYPQCAVFATAYNFVNPHQGNVKKANLKALEPNKETQILPNFFASAAQGDLPFCASSFGIKRTVFNELGGFPNGENMGEDQDLYARVALQHSIAYSQNACANYYLAVAGSLMRSEKAHYEMPYSKRLQCRLNHGNIQANMTQSVKHFIAGHLTDLVRRNLANDNIKAAKSLLQDRRTRLRPIKWSYWYARCSLASLLSTLHICNRQAMEP